MIEHVEQSIARPHRRRLAQPPRKPNFAVKSAMRALEILEYFDDIQSHASVVDVCRALNYPQSSASALLKTLVSAGYLNYRPQSRTYVTAARAALLGGWAGATLTRDGGLIEIMDQLGAETGETIVLATRNGLYAQYIHVVQATNPARLHLSIGTARSLASSAAGHLFLSELRDVDIPGLVNRINAEQIVPGLVLKPAAVLEKVAMVRRQRYAISLDQVTPGGGMIAALLPYSVGDPPLAIGIGGVSQNLMNKEAELVAKLKKKVADYGANLRAAKG